MVQLKAQGKRTGKGFFFSEVQYLFFHYNGNAFTHETQNNSHWESDLQKSDYLNY